MKRKGGKLLAVIVMAASVFSACGAEEQAQKEASDISVEETVDSAETETAVLMDETLRFQGEGTAVFSYERGLLQFSMENDGNTPFDYVVKYPCGCEWMSGTLQMKEAFAQEDLDPTSHEHSPEGDFTLYLNTEDGSEGSCKVLVNAMDA